MCLSVYLGSNDPIQIRNVRNGALGIELAEWTPPALSGFPFRYYLGQKSKGNDLGCSCLLAQHVEWNEHGPTVCLDQHYSEAQCPFEALRSYVAEAQESGRPVVLACDDSGGSPQHCTNEDYDHVIINREMITPTSYLFADPIASFPWRIFYLTAPKSQ